MKACPFCGKDLPPQHAGRGKQKTFCSDTCRVKFAYRVANPSKMTNERKRGFTPPLQLKAAEKAWLAGLWDGEGYIGLGKRRKQPTQRYYYFPVVWVFNTNQVLIEEVVRVLGGGAWCTVFHRPNGSKHKSVYTVKVRRGAMVAFLKGLLPHLFAKRRQAEIVMAFCKISDRCYVREYPESVYEEMWQEMTRLNRRGT